MTEDNGTPAPRRLPSRRTLLAGLGLATVGGLAGAGLAAAGPNNPLGPAWRQALHSFAGSAPATTANTVADTQVERVYSRARGRWVNLVTFFPGGVRPTAKHRLPVCLLLHGLHGNARGAAPPGLVATLAADVRAGRIPPFAFVALDGGDNYWHCDHPGDDPMAMLLDEAPAWLAARGLGDAQGTPFGCAGVSMGGFGALLYTRRRNERRAPVSGAAAVSPGLLTSWRQMSTRHAFQDAAQWAALDPLRNVPALGTVPVGVWCGQQDPFVVGTREFVKSAHPKFVGIWDGAHTNSFFGSCVPSLLSFVGRYAPRDTHSA